MRVNLCRQTFLVILIGVGIQFSEAGVAGKFLYDPKLGRCVDQSGTHGHNSVLVEDLQKNGDGECADLSGMDLDDSLNYNTWKSWNLKGAILTQSKLYFGNIEDAELQGADLESFQYGYAHIFGKTDSFTITPSAGRCALINNQLECFQ